MGWRGHWTVNDIGFQSFNIEDSVYPANIKRFQSRYRIPGREGALGCLLHKSPKFYSNVFVFVDLTTFGTFCILFHWFITLSVQTCQSLIVIYRRGIFVHRHWGCALLSYLLDPCRIHFFLTSILCLGWSLKCLKWI